MGGIRSEPLNTLLPRRFSIGACQEKFGCLLNMSLRIQILRLILPGLFPEDLELSLHRTIFSELQSTIWSRDIDLFAYRVNFKVEKHVSWHPDPGAYAVDAFSLSWSDMVVTFFHLSVLSHVGHVKFSAPPPPPIRVCK